MKRILIISFVLTAILVSVSRPQLVYAQCSAGCQKCEIDFRCQQNKLIDPRSNCEVYYCGDGGARPGTRPSQQILRLNIFGVNIRLNSEQALQQLIIVVFSVFLALVAIVSMLNGVIAAIRRANTTDQAEVAKLIKTMQNSIVGFVIVGMSLLIVQLTASFLGIGNLFSIVTFGNFIPEEDEFTQTN